jgi:hypothetical protein
MPLGSPHRPISDGREGRIPAINPLGLSDGWLDMTDPPPAPAGKPQDSRLAILIALLPIAFGLILPLALGWPGKRVSELIVALMVIPISIASWQLWRGRNNQPAWAWRGGLALAAVAIVALIVSAVAVLLRHH